jgi:gliding motility-associated-like protein
MFRCFSISFFCFLALSLYGQHYWVHQDGSPSWFWNVELHCFCPDCTEYDPQYPTVGFDRGLTITPGRKIYGIDDWGGIFQLDTITGFSTFIFDQPDASGKGLVSPADNLLYYVRGGGPSDSLYVLDPIANTNSFASLLENRVVQDMTLFNGEVYHITGPFSGSGILAKFSLDDPSDGTILFPLPDNTLIRALSPTRQCFTLIGTDVINDVFVSINTIDAVINPLGPLGSTNWTGMTTLVEYEVPGCEVSVDLDCNDSSGAVGKDYHSEEFDCLSDPVHVADVDILLLYDDFIEEMTIELIGFIPDGNNEFLESIGSVPNVDVSGEGSQLITLTNEGGATSNDFRNALKLIVYDNSSIEPTIGGRTVQIQFTTYSGSSSIVATALINVVQGEQYELDLGPDLELCEGDEFNLSTGLLGADHLWSTGSTSHQIMVTQSGQYSVYVTGDEFCPNRDTIEINLLPDVEVSFGPDISACSNELVTVTINVESSIPLTIELMASPGGPMNFQNVTGNVQFVVNGSGTTFYVISGVTPSEPACVELGNEFLLVEVFPYYIDTVIVPLCEGDSIWLDNQWVYAPGHFTDAYLTVDGCDSIVTSIVVTVDVVNLYAQSTSCHLEDIGTTIQIIDNPNGCDTIIQTTVVFADADTTFYSTTSCNTGNAGVFTEQFISSTGCDSIVIHTVIADPPQDTSYTSVTSCDSMNLGVFETIWNNVEGCDSLVITTVRYGIADTTLLFTTSCDSSSLGVFEELFQSQQGCDSLVVTTVEYSESDFTLLSAISCDPAQVGITTDTLTNRFGCDSVVVSDVSLAPSHSINLFSSSCQAADTGTFIQVLINQYGCDSIIMETVDLLPSDETYLTGTTCLSSEAGMFITTHFNQYGCDSTVTLTIMLVNADTTTLTNYTCDPSEVSTQEILLTGEEGCDSLVIEYTLLHPLPQLQIESLQDFNGFDISCSGGLDGSIMALATGEGPFTFQWSTGATLPNIGGLGAGWYFLTVTDNNGCQAAGDITLTEPSLFSFDLSISHPECFDVKSGIIEVIQTGGIAPFMYSVDGENFQTSPLFEDLTGGTYHVVAVDANDCRVEEILWLNVPLMLDVELGEDMVISAGDTTVIEAIINIPYDSLSSVSWSGLNGSNCPTCLSQPVAPVITTTYSVTIISDGGCEDMDDITMFVEAGSDIYVPNIFSPNDDGINDLLVIGAGAEVDRIDHFQIYDRWGNVVFESREFLPNDPSFSWDGTFRKEQLNPGVFAYQVIASLRNGRQIILFGDISLMR